ncbi:hypothetical protein A9R04_25545 [Nocardiopsis dassonvillei]|uniref:hypothetical protein n=1 Tax=Nocardiopsis dassonvillei TaxID=2014 RepID=UPI0008FCB218|nr:hypothetical protein [Nocardiopsis dassonvillei]APC37834.1 hypothetical protein A9R04_25545 [Nocardiopsis dassonvillei]
MTAQLTEPTTATTARDLRCQAAQILARLLSEDLPEITWQVYEVSRFLDLYTGHPQDHEVLNGYADSHQAVRAWADYLSASVSLRHGDTPQTSAVIDGVGVRVWCAPERRDDTNALEA